MRKLLIINFVASVLIIVTVSFAAVLAVRTKDTSENRLTQTQVIDSLKDLKASHLRDIGPGQPMYHIEVENAYNRLIQNEEAR